MVHVNGAPPHSAPPLALYLNTCSSQQHIALPSDRVDNAGNGLVVAH